MCDRAPSVRTLITFESPVPKATPDRAVASLPFPLRASAVAPSLSEADRADEAPTAQATELEAGSAARADAAAPDRSNGADVVAPLPNGGASEAAPAAQAAVGDEGAPSMVSAASGAAADGPPKPRSAAAEAHAAILEGRIAMVRGDLSAAEAALRRALVFAKQADDAGQIAASYRQMAELAGLRGDPMSATHALQRALAAVERGGDRGAQAEVMVELGRLIEQGGKADRARQIFLDALHLATAAQAFEAVAGAAGELGRLLGQQGDIDAALRHYQTAAHAYHTLQEGPDHEAEALVYLAMADLEEVRRDGRAATGWLEAAWALDEATSDTRRRIGGRLGWGLLLLRRRDEGIAVLDGVRALLLEDGAAEEAEALHAQITELRAWPREGVAFAFALVRHGERRAAEAAIALDAEDQLKRGDLKGALCSLGGLYWLLFDRGDMGAASRTFKRAMNLAAAAPEEQRLLRKLRKNLETSGQA